MRGLHCETPAFGVPLCAKQICVTGNILSVGVEAALALAPWTTEGGTHLVGDDAHQVVDAFSSISSMGKTTVKPSPKDATIVWQRCSD